MALSYCAGLKEKWTSALEWGETQAKTNRYLYGAGGLALLVVAIALTALLCYGVSLVYIEFGSPQGGVVTFTAIMIGMPILVPIGYFGGKILYAAIRHSEGDLPKNSLEDNL